MEDNNNRDKLNKAGADNMKVSYAKGTDLTTPIINLTKGKSYSKFSNTKRIKEYESILALEGEERKAKAIKFRDALFKIPKERLILNTGKFVFDLVCFKEDFTDYSVQCVECVVFERTVLPNLNYISYEVGVADTPSKVLAKELRERLPEEWQINYIIAIESV